MSTDLYVRGVGETERAAGFAATAFRWPFRRYQRLALEAFERGRAAGRRRAYLVMPPGSGKTALGLEIARRLGARTLVLCPNSAVQAQWLRQWRDFRPATVPAGPEPDLGTPVTVLTYQALCILETDDDSLDEEARFLWREALQGSRGLSPDQAEEEIARLFAAHPRLYREELAAYRRRVRTLIARGGDREAVLALLHPNGRAVVERMKATGQESGAWTLVLDECHHLLKTWGSLVRALVEELDDAVFVVGLTATPPDEMDAREAALYRDLFGRADFAVPTPAVVRAGDLAPYQELAYLTTPLPHEADYVASQHVRFRTLLDHLLDPGFGSLSFVHWVLRRAVQRQGKDGARISWAAFERQDPALADAALRFLVHHRLELPSEARLGERHRREPDADDWVALIEDYCLGHLKLSGDPRDHAAWKEIGRALPALGYVLARQGIRSYVSPVDRVLALSASKAVAAVEILDAERRALGPNLRALALCDYELAGREVLAKLRGVLDPQAGSAALLLQILLSSSVSAELDPILVTGRTVACSRATALVLADWIEEQVPALRGTVATERLFEAGPGRAGDVAWDDVMVIRPGHAWWRPRHYAPLLTRYFEEGRSRCLVGTRGLLGEGWDAQRVNVLIDLTAASTSTAVHQMRGRSIRLDPTMPRKVANNWDVVCVAPEHPKGLGDYARFVRKHRRHYAPTADGEIESGVSHVHPALSPFGPPPVAAIPEINRELLRRAADREAAYERWQVGTPFENKESQTLRIRVARPVGLPGPRSLRAAGASAATPRFGRRAVALGAVATGIGVAGGAVGPDVIGLAGGLVTAAAGAGWLGRSMRQSLARLGPSDALEDFAAAVAEALAATGAIDRTLGASAVRLTTDCDGYYRCFLAGASLAESALFAESLDELLAPLASPRYIIPRFVAGPPRSAVGALRLAIRQGIRGAPSAVAVYHAVPACLAVNRERVAAFASAWNAHVSPGAPLYHKHPRAQGILAVQRGDDPFAVTTQLRMLWS